jgi:hypothetical protein
MEYSAGKIETNGVTVPILVNDQGEWRAEYDGRTLVYPTREKLEAAIKRLTKRAAVVIEMAAVRIEKTADGVRRVRATFTGIHGANGNALATLHFSDRRGDVKEQISFRYGSQAGLWFGGDVTDEEIAKFGHLIKVANEAKQAVDRMQGRLQIDLQKAIERAVAARTPEDD